MLVKRHDGTFGPSTLRHTVGETLSIHCDAQARLLASADQALADLTAEWQPAAGEVFLVFARLPQHTNPRTGGWALVYTTPAPLTRMLAARVTALRGNPAVEEIVVLSGSPAEIGDARRDWIKAAGFDPYFLRVAP
jgi:hypothetical protein